MMTLSADQEAVLNVFVRSMAESRSETALSIGVIASRAGLPFDRSKDAAVALDDLGMMIVGSRIAPSPDTLCMPVGKGLAVIRNRAGNLSGPPDTAEPPLGSTAADER